MSKALLAQSRPIVYHACHCGWADVWEWAADLGANQWRIGQDISDDFNYPGLREKYYFDVLDMLDRGAKLARYAGPGHWNDFDMLIVGLHGRSGQLVGTGASDVEYRAHFGLWAMVASPLLIGADVRTLDAESLATLTNQEVIAVDQDPTGHAAEKASESADGLLQVWSKEMADGSVVVALLNRGAATADMTVSPRRDLGEPWVRYRVRDLWKHRDAGPYDIPYTTEVMSHEAQLLRLFPLEVKP
jgi:alpha-galactosidase